MKRLLASVALLVAVSACSGEAEEPAAPVEEATEAPAAATMESYVGNWTVTQPDGATHTTVNNADGTYTSTMADGTAVNGTWTFGADQSCWTPEGGEAACYGVMLDETGDAGTLTGADGVQTTVTRIAAEAAPAAAEAAPAAAE